MAKIIHGILGGYYKVLPIWVIYLMVSAALVCADQWNMGIVFHIGIGIGILWIISMLYTILFVRR